MKKTTSPLSKSIFLLLFGVLLLLQPMALQADSPLTSTPFHEAYLDVRMVRYAQEKGKMDKKIARFLLKKKKSIAVKAAVINALGWDPDGQNNAEIFLPYLLQKRKISAENPDWSQLGAADLMCMGYLMAMDDYFDCEAAEKVLLTARERDPKSFTVALVHSLVLAQVMFDSDWCMVWRVVAETVADGRLDREMNEFAVEIVMEYIGLYEESC